MQGGVSKYESVCRSRKTFIHAKIHSDDRRSGLIDGGHVRRRSTRPCFGKPTQLYTSHSALKALLSGFDFSKPWHEAAPEAEAHRKLLRAAMYQLFYCHTGGVSWREGGALLRSVRPPDSGDMRWN